MRFPYSIVHSFEGAQRNFEFLEGSGLYWGSGAPAFLPANKDVSFYLRKDTPTVANQRIYIFNGTAWVGIV